MLNEVRGKIQWSENSDAIHKNSPEMKGLQKDQLKVKKMGKVNSVCKNKERNLKS